MRPAEARDDICAFFKLYWDTYAGVANDSPGFPPEVYWEGKEASSAPSQGSSYARLTIVPASESQTTLADDTGSKRYTALGSVIVQCFAPRGRRGLTLAEALATVARDAFRGKKSPGGVWFRDAVVKTVGPDKGWFQVNAVTQYLYDDVA